MVKSLTEVQKENRRVWTEERHCVLYGEGTFFHGDPEVMDFVTKSSNLLVVSVNLTTRDGILRLTTRSGVND